MHIDVSKPHLKSDSLAFSLLAAARAVAQVKSGTALPQALGAVLAPLNASAQARGATQDIAYRTMRRLASVEALIRRLTNKPPAPAELHGLLCCALALICAGIDAPGDAPYESFTIVDQAVTAASATPALAPAKGMVNAVLRRFLREHEALLSEIRRNESARWNYPAWWIDTLKSAYPSQWQTILEAGNGTPPLTLRVNRRRTDVDAYLRVLSDNNIAASRIGPDAVRLARAVPVAQIPGFSSGLVSVQDAAAQLAAPLLDLQPGMRVLDACAAPGGKTGHILECADVEVLALDCDAQRLARIDENLQRLQLHAALNEGDASGSDWWDGRQFDRILADVPCTASGIVRRHPDIRWLRRKEDAVRLATHSAQILDNLWRMLRPDGKLLFVTCSIWPQESEMQAASFAARNNAIRLAAPGQLLPVANVEQDYDGLFYALFQKTAV
ncbi:16S rRNA (cytosine(967)-C(5))-methyltransferase RsmB [Noviherbaspirillum sp. UKPF54]|uniref:16S rRNA (cytosine(967)-C(5))-methyltransferase RsmB n=1 Tax=Noviherbaspirillum sp. UKPF54 TaxID=2601898 RepID=UPI0011B10CFB|nr:16S rRNA (cytosine(967)-C(5))-methyltransferase RsmB [Noviherbaspirillum sp. UKPF54]QDZ29231.1 16S rRNA (cytosine(967)-C(5))-methyltransferase RsmB [Noviherbaspirillum sp. UKPF54]